MVEDRQTQDNNHSNGLNGLDDETLFGTQFLGLFLKAVAKFIWKKPLRLQSQNGYRM